MDEILGMLGGGGGGGGKSYGNSEAVSSVNFARGRDGATPLAQWLPYALGAVVFIIVAYLVTNKGKH